MRVIGLLVLVGAVELQVTPVQKVIQLLNGMLEKGKKEKHEEQVQFASYQQFCTDTSTQKERAIAEANEQLETLAASIEKNEADAATLAKEISQLDEDISVWTGDKKAATEVRELENANYLKTHQDYSESIDSVAAAVATVSKQDKDVSQSLMQVSNSRMTPAHAKQVITAFLAEGEKSLQDPMAVSAPEANAYEFQSSGILDMFNKLDDKFEDERSELEKKESNQRHAFEMLMQDLAANIDRATADRESKASTRASKLQKAAEHKGDHADTTATRDSDTSYLSDLNAECSQKSSDFDNRQQLRSDELSAIEKAIEIMSSGAVSGNADKHLPALVEASSVSFVQIGSTNPSQVRVANFLREKGVAINSRVLSALAVRVAEDPFVKVKKMIKDLIVRLMEEANEEAEHKGWCDTELSTNEQTRKEKTSAVETLHAEIDELSASIAKLTQDITDLTQQVADSDKALAEATEIREKEKATNTETIADAKEASTAVAQALTVLKEFYDKAGEATSFVQSTQKPEIFDTPYQGMQSENGGVVGMLEVIQSDFARLETDTQAAETENQNAYDKFSNDSALNRAEMSKDIDHKTNKKTNQEGALAAAKADLDGTQKELDAALAYYEKLKPSCVDAGVSYEDRVARRKEEIESLQEALRILNGEDIAFLQH